MPAAASTSSNSQQLENEIICKHQNTIELCKRLNLSPEATMMVVNVGNLDHNVEEESEYVSRTGVREDIDKIGKAKVARHTALNQLPKWIQVDGREDVSLMPGTTKEKETHYTITVQPGGHYLTNFVKPKSTPEAKIGAEVLCNKLIEALNPYNGTASTFGMNADGTGKIFYLLCLIKFLHHDKHFGIAFIIVNELRNNQMGILMKVL